VTKGHKEACNYVNYTCTTVSVTSMQFEVTWVGMNDPMQQLVPKREAGLFSGVDIYFCEVTCINSLILQVFPLLVRHNCGYIRCIIVVQSMYSPSRAVYHITTCVAPARMNSSPRSPQKRTTALFIQFTLLCSISLLGFTTTWQ